MKKSEMIDLIAETIFSYRKDMASVDIARKVLDLQEKLGMLPPLQEIEFPSESYNPTTRKTEPVTVRTLRNEWEPENE